MGWTEKQYFEENTTSFIEELGFALKEKYKQ
jgi:hypothetical protein